MAATQASTGPNGCKDLRESAEFLASPAEFFVFRRFDALAFRNLHYLQGKLINLENELKGGDGQQSGTDQNQLDREAIKETINETIKEYQEALIRQNVVLQMQSPDSDILSTVTDLLKRESPSGVNHNEPFRNAHDIVSLKSSADQDRLSKYIQAFYGYIRKATPGKKQRPVPEYGDISKVVSIASVILATTLLFGAILALNFVPTKNHALRLAVIFVCMLSFAITVGILTNAKRSELFAAVAGYSAVLVVFSTVNVDQ